MTRPPRAAPSRQRRKPRKPPKSDAPRRTLAAEPAPLAGAGRATAVLATVIGLFALALYLRTLAPTVTLVDSGELTVAAHGLGVAHPPGFPLWVMLAHLATLLPWGSVAERVNGSSALFAAIAAGLLVVAFREASLGNAETPTSARATWRWPDLAPPALAGLLLAASRELWAYATVAEVYALNTLLSIGILALLFRWRRSPADDRPLLVAAALFGLALGVHHVTVALLLPALAWLVWKSAGSRFFRSARLARAALLSFAAFVAVYLYLPWAARRETGLNWGDPRDLTGILRHLTGRQYQSFLAPTAASLRAELADWAALLSSAFGPPWLPLALALAAVGLWSLRRSDRTLFVTLAFVATANTLFGLVYTIAEDKDAYYLPTIAVLALAAGFGASRLLAALPVRLRIPAAATLLALPLVALLPAWTASDRSDERIAERFVADSLAGVAPGGLVLTGEWQLYSPLLYFREVENLRPDVVAIDVQLLRRSWYFDLLERRAPALLAAAKQEVDLYLGDLRAWESDPTKFDRDPALGQRINRRFFAMILALVARQLERGPVYVSHDIALPAFPSEPQLPPLLAARYDLAPEGLLFELRPDRTFVESGAQGLMPLHPAIARLFDPARPVERWNPAPVKVRTAYLMMIASRGLYLANYGRDGAARDALRQALALDPTFEPARRALASLDALDERSAGPPGE